MKWIKIIILCCMVFMISCTKTEIEPIPQPTKQKIFSVTESRVLNGQDIYFDLPTAGVYTLTLIDKQTGNVISRERFSGIAGENVKKIYTNSIESQYLYMLLQDVTKAEIGKTTIITK